MHVRYDALPTLQRCKESSVWSMDKDMREDQDGGGGEDDDDDWIEPTKAVGNRRKVKSLLV